MTLLYDSIDCNNINPDPFENGYCPSTPSIIDIKKFILAESDDKMDITSELQNLEEISTLVNECKTSIYVNDKIVVKMMDANSIYFRIPDDDCVLDSDSFKKHWLYCEFEAGKKLRKFNSPHLAKTYAITIAQYDKQNKTMTDAENGNSHRKYVLLIQERIVGETLYKLYKEKRIDTKMLIHMIIDVINIIKILPFTHYDLHSHNIMFDKINKKIVIIDFGFTYVPGMDMTFEKPLYSYVIIGSDGTLGVYDPYEDFFTLIRSFYRDETIFNHLKNTFHPFGWDLELIDFLWSCGIKPYVGYHCAIFNETDELSLTALRDRIKEINPNIYSDENRVLTQKHIVQALFQYKNYTIKHTGGMINGKKLSKVEYADEIIKVLQSFL